MLHYGFSEKCVSVESAKGVPRGANATQVERNGWNALVGGSVEGRRAWQAAGQTTREVACEGACGRQAVGRPRKRVGWNEGGRQAVGSEGGVERKRVGGVSTVRPVEQNTATSGVGGSQSNDRR
eukprot:4091046-Pleurochrysis_carterae.AAC.1